VSRNEEEERQSERVRERLRVDVKREERNVTGIEHRPSTRQHIDQRVCWWWWWWCDARHKVRDSTMMTMMEMTLTGFDLSSAIIRVGHGGVKHTQKIKARSREIDCVRRLHWVSATRPRDEVRKLEQKKIECVTHLRLTSGECP
jgi:hypothetical protein